MNVKCEKWEEALLGRMDKQNAFGFLWTLYHVKLVHSGEEICKIYMR